MDIEVVRCRFRLLWGKLQFNQPKSPKRHQLDALGMHFFGRTQTWQVIYLWTRKYIVRLILLHYSLLLWFVIFKHVSPFYLAALISHLWLWQRLLGGLFCNDKWNKFASYGSPNLVLRFYAIIFMKKYWYWNFSIF